MYGTIYWNSLYRYVSFIHDILYINYIVVENILTFSPIYYIHIMYAKTSMVSSRYSLEV